MEEGSSKGEDTSELVHSVDTNGETRTRDSYLKSFELREILGRRKEERNLKRRFKMRLGLGRRVRVGSRF